MKKRSIHISTASMLVLLLLVTAISVFCYFYIAKPVEVDNFVGPSELNPYPDGLDWLRRLFIYPGLIISISALILFIKSAFGKNAAAPDKILNYILLLLIFSLGWVSLPYWANGLHHVFSQGTSSMYDPKSLLPHNDISFVWNSLVMAFHLFAFILILIPVIIAILDIRKNGFDKKYIYAFIVYLLIFVPFYFAPNYMYWFLD